MEYRNVETLVPYPDNPRKITDRGLERLGASLQKHPRFFEARPLMLSDRTGALVVIGGNQKLAAAKLLGMAEVPTELLSGLTEAEEREYVIRDNAHAGDFDYDVLSTDPWEDHKLAEWGVPIPWIASHEDAADGEEPPFVANEHPQMERTEVQEEDIEAMEQRMQSRAEAEQEYVQVECPHCAGRFAIDRRDLPAEVGA